MLMNKESKRETPAVVSFGDKMRFIGTDGAAKISMNPKNTPHQLKRLLGKQFKDPAVQADIARLPFKVTEGPDGGCLVHVTFCNEPASYTPEQLMAMVLVDLKKIAEAESGIAVTDCAISVPTYYTGVLMSPVAVKTSSAQSGSRSACSYTMLNATLIATAPTLLTLCVSMLLLLLLLLQRWSAMPC